jgi:hypothetical protein
MVNQGRPHMSSEAGVAARWRLRPWWVLGVAVLAAPLAGLVAGVWLPATSAVLVAVVTVVAGLAAPVAERARTEIADRAQRRRDLQGRSAGVSEEGRLPRVRECVDPIALGVHPAAASADGDRVPPFVRRDLEADLRLVLSRPGLVLVVGESTAGKSRLAYEAMRAVLSDHVLVHPFDGDALAVLAPVVAEQVRCVVWLDDLERYLGTGGLSPELLTRLLGDGSRHVVVLATMRTQEHARFDRAREFSLDNPARHAWRRGRDVIERAREVNLDRRWSAAEVQRARAVADDPRLAQAVGQAERFGVAEILAAGPQLVTTVRNAWTPGLHPRGAALVAAAVDCRRAGLHRPLPLAVLESIHEVYLAARGGADLRPEPIQRALAFATEPVYATTSPLLPDGAGGYLAHDYLIDALAQGRIPDRTWQVLLAHITAREAFDLGMTAYNMHHINEAHAAFERAAAGGIPGSRPMLGVVLGEQGRVNEGADLLANVLTDQTRQLGIDHPPTMATRSALARLAGLSGDPAAAQAALYELLADQIRVLGADHQDTLNTRRELANWTATVDTGAAVTALRDVLADHVRTLGADHIATLDTRRDLAYWTAHTGDTVAAAAAYQELLRDYTRVLGADHAHTLEVRHRRAHLIADSGDPATAIDELRDLLADQTHALGPDHPDTMITRRSLTHYTQASHPPADQTPMA